MQNTSVNKGVDLRTMASFRDSEAWASMCRYSLPDYSIPCTVDAMISWLDRLDIGSSEYLIAWPNHPERQKFPKSIRLRESLNDFITMNPDWPLAAWVGLMSEMVNEQEDKR